MAYDENRDGGGCFAVVITNLIFMLIVLALLGWLLDFF